MRLYPPSSTQQADGDRNVLPSNEIGERQNSPQMIKLLRARRRVYASVKALQRGYFFITLMLPVAALVTAACSGNVRPGLSLFALVVGAVDAMFLDSWRKRRIKLAAKLQEEFDCEVLAIRWNKFIVGAPVSREDIEQCGGKLLNEKAERALIDWYPAEARQLPLHLARLVCQRANLWYDSKLRRTYCLSLWILTAIYFLSLVIFGRDLPLSNFILAILVPFGPFFTWVVREQHRQKDSIALVDRLIGEIEGSMAHFSRPKDEVAAHDRARELQDAIFAHRASSPLVSDLVYWSKRKKLEKQMQVAAGDFISRLTQAARAA